MIWDIIEEDKTFDSHFQNQNLTIEELLLDENILTELQNLHPQLLTFLRNNTEIIVSKLIEYVTIVPSPTDSHERCFKLPYMSSEILAINNPIFYNAFFPSDDGEDSSSELFIQLIDFLSSDAADNEILLGYFEKVINNLYQGRKKQVTKGVDAQLKVFKDNLHRECIGGLLRDCVVLLGLDDGVMIHQRKRIIDALLEGLIGEGEQRRKVCGNVIVDISAKYKTFSSGQQILNHVLLSPTFSQIFSQDTIPETTTFLTALLTKSNNKIFDPHLDTYVKIFSLPAEHAESVSKLISSRLEACRNIPVEMSQVIQQQDRRNVVRVSQQIIGFFALVSAALSNGITSFLDEGMVVFGLQCMSRHTRCDILLVHIDKVLSKAIEIREELTSTIIEAICKLGEKQKQIRGHLFPLWSAIDKMGNSGANSETWKELSKIYGQLRDIYNSKVSVDVKNRPKNTKIIVDEQEANAVSISTQATGMGQEEPAHIMVQVDCLEKIPKKENNIENKKNNNHEYEEKQRSKVEEQPKQKGQQQQKEKEKSKSKVESDPFAEFGNWGAKAEKKKNSTQFGDFSDFNF